MGAQLTTLIPAYKPDYLAALFAGLRSQVFRDFRVIVSDDSPDATITSMLRAGRFDPFIEGLDMLVVRGPQSPLRNHQHLLDVWAHATPLVHLLMDDDVVYPRFYLEHVALHARHSPAASVSLRWLTSSDGAPMATLPLPEFVEAGDRHSLAVGAEQLFASTVARCENWLGELSNMVLSASAADGFPRPPTDGVSYFGLPDIGTLLNAVQRAPIVVLRDHLGGFRQHRGQTTLNTQLTNLKIAFLAWVAYALKAHQDGHLDAEAAAVAIAIATHRCLQHYATDPVMRGYLEIVRNNLGDLPRFEAAFVPFWQSMLHSCPDTRPDAWGPTASRLTESAPTA